MNPYRLGARIASPYAFVYGTALTLHGVGGVERSEVLVASPHRFGAFEYEGCSTDVHCRGLTAGWRRCPWGPEFVWVTTPERTLVDCVRVPVNAGGVAELMRLSGLAALNSDQLLRWVDSYGEANLAARLGFVLESAGMSDDAMLNALEARRPASRAYLEPGVRGGRLVKRWNLIVPSYLVPRKGQPG